jgi:hypothetical protein
MRHRSGSYASIVGNSGLAVKQGILTRCSGEISMPVIIRFLHTENGPDLIKQINPKEKVLTFTN